MNETALQVTTPLSTNLILASYLTDFETRSEQAARQNLENALELAGTALDSYTDPEVRAMVKLEQLKLIGDLSLAELLLRGKLIKEIEDDALWSIHPNRYANMQEAAKSQGIGISEYSNIRDLYNIVFPYLCDTLGMNLALVWEEIGKSNFRDLTPYLVRAITGEVSQSRNVESFIEQLTENIAASFDNDDPGNDGLIHEEVVRQLMSAGTQTNRDLRQRIRQNDQHRIPAYVLEVPGEVSQRRIFVSLVDPEEYALIQRKLRGVVETHPTQIDHLNQTPLNVLFN